MKARSLAGVPAAPLEVLRRLGLDQFFRIYDTREEAAVAWT